MFGNDLVTRRQAQAEAEAEAEYSRWISGKKYREVYLAMNQEEIDRETAYYQARNCIVKLVPQRYGVLICVRERGS